MLNDAMGFSGTAPLSWGFEYQQEFKLKRGVTFSFGQAGHILGSCFIRFEFPNHVGTQGDKPYSVIFSGDLGNKDTPLLRDPDPPPHCDLPPARIHLWQPTSRRTATEA